MPLNSIFSQVRSIWAEKKRNLLGIPKLVGIFGGYANYRETNSYFPVKNIQFLCKIKNMKLGKNINATHLMRIMPNFFKVKYCFLYLNENTIITYHGIHMIYGYLLSTHLILSGFYLFKLWQLHYIKPWKHYIKILRFFYIKN